MKPNEFVAELEKRDSVIGNVLVLLMLKYDHEKTYHFENQILTYDGKYGYEWLNDWYEGQELTEVIGWINLDEWWNDSWEVLINGKLLIFKDCPLCKRAFDQTCEKCGFNKDLKKRSGKWK